MKELKATILLRVLPGDARVGPDRKGIGFKAALPLYTKKHGEFMPDASSHRVHNFVRKYSNLTKISEMMQCGAF